MGGLDGQRRCDRIRDRALRWVGVQQLHPDRHDHRDGHRLQGHHRQLRHQLQLPGTRDRRRRKPQHLLQHGLGRDARHHRSSQPGTLSATAASGGEIDLSWGASTDNVGVSGYRIERCAGSACSNFTQIATTTGTGTGYKDTTVNSATSYSYRVRATDAAGNLSTYSNTASAADARHHRSVTAGNAQRDRGLKRRDRPLLGRVHRQRRRQRLPHRALRRVGVQQLHPDRHHHRHGHRLQGHHRQLRHQLQLPGTRDRRRRKPQHLLQHGRRDDARGAVGFGRRVCVR